MHRYPELAHRVGMIQEVQDAKHLAIDKITALNIASQSLNRVNYDPVTELVKEERMASLISDAHYFWQQYVTLKLKRYEELMREQSNEKSDTIVKQANFIAKQESEIENLKGEL